MFSSALVCLFAGLRKNYSVDFFYTKFGGKVTHGPRKKPLGFGDNPDHVTLLLQLGLRLGGVGVPP